MKNAHFKNIFSLLLLLNVFTSNAQTRTPKLLYTIPESVYHASTDELGNLYIITKNKKLIKYNDKGKEIGAYSSVYIDSTTMLCTNNAMKTLLFTPNDGLLNTLDNNMALNSKVNIYDKGVMNPSLFGWYSNNTSIWLFDKNKQTLQRYNNNFEAEFSSKNIAQMEGKTFNPILLLQHQKFIALLDTTQGILSFDAEGNYQKLYPISGAYDAFLFDLSMFLAIKNEIHLFDLRSGSITYAYTFPGAISLKFGYPYCAVRYQDKVELYQLFY